VSAAAFAVTDTTSGNAGPRGLDSRVKELIERGETLHGKRGLLLSLWQEVAENFYPERGEFTRQIPLGEEFAGILNSSYPLLVRRELGNSFSSMLRPTNQDWFQITTSQPDKLDRAGRAWLEWASGVQKRAMYDRLTNFVRATKEGDNDFAAFGQCVISREIDMKEQVLLYRNWHLKDVAWAEHYNGQIGEVYARWRPSVQTLCKLFPKTVSQKTKDRLAKDPHGEVDCYRIVVRSDSYDTPAGGKKWRNPWCALYVERDAQNLLEETDSPSRIFTIPRWQTVGSMQYAYSPATICGLPDARLIQAMTLTILEAGELATRPPLIATKQAIRSDLAIYAGGVTWVDAEYDERLGEVLRPIYQEKGGIPIGKDLLKDSRDMLAQAFYLNKLALPPPERDMTAYETGQRIQEYIREAMPLFEPMETEYNAALCEDTFEGLMRVGAFGSPYDIPDSIQGQNVRFVFESPLHKALERQKGSQFMEMKQLILEAVDLDPVVTQMPNAVDALRDALTGIGTPQKWLRDEKDMAQRAQQADAQQRAQQMMQAVHAGGAVAQQVGDGIQSLQKVAPQPAALGAQ
jgi:hypothetical protein